MRGGSRGRRIVSAVIVGILDIGLDACATGHRRSGQRSASVILLFVFGVATRPGGGDSDGMCDCRRVRGQLCFGIGAGTGHGLADSGRLADGRSCQIVLLVTGGLHLSSIGFIRVAGARLGDGRRTGDARVLLPYAQLLHDALVLR
jgi:hypothetical protein